jgi:hypothetical protein
MTEYSYTENGIIQFFERNNENSITSGFIRDQKTIQRVVDSGVHIAPYIAPVIPDLSTQDKINALEAQQTPRMLREVALGNADSITKLQAIETEIAELRKQL